MAGNEVDKEVLIMAVSRGQIGHHTISGNISLFQIHQKLKTVLQRLQPANFVTKCSVVAVLPGQQLMILLNCCMKENWKHPKLQWSMRQKLCFLKVDIIQNKVFWSTAKFWVELSEPAMNLFCLADCYIPGTSKVYLKMFKTDKLLDAMSVEYDFIPKAMQDAISTKWMQCWTDLHCQLHGVGYCLDTEFHSHDHYACTAALKDLFFMCDYVHWTGSVALAKA